MAYLPPDQIPPGTSPATRAAIIDMIRSSSQIVSVAGETERNQVLAAWEEATGAPVGPLNPCWVDRADTGALERNRGNGWQRFKVEQDSGVQSAGGPSGYNNNTRYRVRDGVATIAVDATATSSRPAGTLEGLIPANPDLAQTLSNDLRAVLYQTTTGGAVAARIFANGQMNAYGLPAMNSGHRIYGVVSYPVG